MKTRQRPPSREDRRGTSNAYPPNFHPWPHDEDVKRKRKRKKRLSVLRGWLPKFLLVVGVIAALVTFVAYYPGFYINTFLIKGNVHVSSAAIMEGVEKPIGEHFIYGLGDSVSQFFTLRYGGIEQRVAELNPVLEEVRAYFRFPSTVVIKVREKTEVIALRVTDGYALLDRNFDVIRVVALPQFDLPILEGVRVLVPPEPGKQVAVEDPDELAAALNITAAMIRQDESDTSSEILLMDAVRKIRRDDGETYFLFIPIEQGGEIRVKLKDNRLLPQKLALLSRLLNSWQLKERGTGELDMTGERAVFKPDAAK